MPKSPEQSRKSAAETPFPQEKARDQAQIIAHPQVPPADAEEGEEPAKRQLQTEDELAKDGKPAVQGPQKIQTWPQQHAAEQAAQKPPEDQRRAHGRKPRFRRGSS